MYVGNYGYSWSSTASGPNGIYLYFCAAWIDSSFAYPRAYGFQLRCLSEVRVALTNSRVYPKAASTTILPIQPQRNVVSLRPAGVTRTPPAKGSSILLG